MYMDWLSCSFVLVKIACDSGNYRSPLQVYCKYIFVGLRSLHHKSTFADTSVQGIVSLLLKLKISVSNPPKESVIYIASLTFLLYYRLQSFLRPIPDDYNQLHIHS